MAVVECSPDSKREEVHSRGAKDSEIMWEKENQDSSSLEVFLKFNQHLELYIEANWQAMQSWSSQVILLYWDTPIIARPLNSVPATASTCSSRQQYIEYKNPIRSNV